MDTTYFAWFLWIIPWFGIIYLWFDLSEAIYKETQERRHGDHGSAKKSESLGEEINLLALKQRAMAQKQSKTLHLFMHEPQKPKGKGTGSLIPKATQ